MPFRHAHYWLLLLVPVVLIAFWPGYFSMVREVPFALHAHGLSAILWLVLLIAQSWTIARRRPVLHRTIGLATFVAVPLFAAGGILAIQAMAQLGLGRADPFHIAFGARLAMEDLISVIAFLLLVGIALANRRRAWIHGAAMLSTMLLVLPPVTGRLFQHIPGFPFGLAEGVNAFWLAFEVAQALTIVGALWLAYRYPRSAWVFRLTAIVTLGESLMFETVARSAGWEALLAATLGIPAGVLAAAGLLAGAIVCWVAWRQGEPGRKRVPAM